MRERGLGAAFHQRSSGPFARHRRIAPGLLRLRFGIVPKHPSIPTRLFFQPGCGVQHYCQWLHVVRFDVAVNEKPFPIFRDIVGK